MTSASTLQDRGWASVVLLVRWILSLYGAPGEIAARGWLTRGLRRQLLIWLRTGEAFARRLIALRAAELGPQNAPPKRGRMRAAAARYGRGGFAHEDSARWSVRVRFLSAESSWGRRSRNPGSGLTARRPLDPGFGLRPPQDDSGQDLAHPSSPARGRQPEGPEGATVGHGTDRPLRRAVGPLPPPRGGGRLFSSFPLAERLEALIRVAADPDRYARRRRRRLAKAAPAPTPLGEPTLTAFEGLVSQLARRRPPSPDSG